MSTPPVAVVHDDERLHRAARVWNQSTFCRRSPTRVEVLRERSPTTVYRLIGAGPGGTNVIAKRYPPGEGAAERCVYEHILPHLPISAPRCYGVRAVDEPGGDIARWLFLEDVGTERYSDRNQSHLRLTARWIAHLHRRAANLVAVRQLPDAGPGRYRTHLDAARNRLAQRLTRGALTAADRTMLGQIITLLDDLAARWSGLEAACVGLPPTLVHGDFRPKNVYLRRQRGRLACYPIDWETAGWGVPAVDLTRVDVATYWGVARVRQFGLDAERVRHLAKLGHVFRTIAAIDWESTGLGFESRRMISRPLASLGVLLRQLRDAVGSAEIEL